MEALTLRQMANEIKAIGMEKATALERAQAKRRMPEMVAITQHKVDALRQIWSLLDRMAKAEQDADEIVEPVRETVPPPPPQSSPPPDDDDDF